MIYFQDNQFHFFSLVARFRAHGELTQKYTNDRRYWENFVDKWWHHDSLGFESVRPTEEQQARLGELNALPDISGLYDFEAAEFVEFGVILPDTEAPFLQPLIEQQAAITLQHYQTLAKDEARAKRWEAEQSGTELNGMTLRTDEHSQSRVTSLVAAVQADPDADNFDFEMQSGEWVTIDRDTAIAIGKAVSNHVQACFTNCKRLHDLIQQAETLEALNDIDSDDGWPVS